MQKTSSVHESLLFWSTSSSFSSSRDFISGCVNTRKDQLPARNVGAHPPSLPPLGLSVFARLETWFHRLGMCWHSELGRVLATSSGFQHQAGRPPFNSCYAVQPQQSFRLNYYLLIVCVLIVNAGRSATKVHVLVLLSSFFAVASRCPEMCTYLIDSLFSHTNW